MKVFDNIEIFYRRKGANGEAVAISDEEFQEGLRTLIEAVIPYRKDSKECISAYLKTRDGLPLTASIAEKEYSPDCNIEVGRKEVDLAVFRIIYDDRYSFGHLYWYLLRKLENELDGLDQFIDPEAPYKKGVIEYAINYDLTKTVEEYESRENLDDRYQYVQDCLRRSQGEILIKHRIKEDYENAVSLLLEECRTEIKDLDKAVQEVGAGEAPEPPSTQEPASTASHRSIGGTPFALCYVIDRKNRERLMTYLHDHIDGKEKQSAIVYIQAAMNAGLLTMPEYTEFEKEFGSLIGKSQYHNHLDSNGRGDFKGLSKVLVDTTEELKKMFK